MDSSYRVQAPFLSPRTLINFELGTACWPCRQRKVKCDNKQPCVNCESRNHANLCSYNPKQHGEHSQKPKAKGKGKSPAGLTPDSISGVKRPHSPDSENSQRQDRWPANTGMNCYHYLLQLLCTILRSTLLGGGLKRRYHV